MSISHLHDSLKSGWWGALRLRGSLGTDAAERVLCEHVPVGFAPAAGGSVLSLKQVGAFVDAAEQEAECAREVATAERRAADATEFEATFDMPDADTVVEEGRWAGFTRGEAAAWCWNLFQFEPHGFVHPGSQVRAEALEKLRAGGLPGVFGYPERARQLAEKDMTPRHYRQHRGALGSRMFDPADVRRR